jgi:hypothetical protein
VAGQEVKRDNGGSQAADDYTFFYGNNNTNHYLVMGLLIHKGIRAVVKRVAFISDRMLYMILSRHWCDIILNVNAPTEEISDDTKDNFYRGLVHVFNHFLKYQISNLSEISLQE